MEKNIDHLKEIYSAIFSCDNDPEELDEVFDRLFLHKPNYMLILSNIQDRQDHEIIMITTDFIKRCVNHLSSTSINQKFNSYHNLLCIVCALNQTIEDSESYKFLLELLYEPKIFDKIAQFCSENLNHFNEEQQKFILTTYNLLVVKHLLSKRKIKSYFSGTVLVQALNLQSVNLINKYSVAIIDAFNLSMVIHPNEVNNLFSILMDPSNMAALLKILIFLLKHEIQNFTKLYHNYSMRGVVETIKTKIGYQDSNYPYIEHFRALSIIQITKLVISDKQNSAKLIGCKIYETRDGHKILFPSEEPSHLLEHIFEYFSAIVFSMSSTSIDVVRTKNLVDTLEFAIILMDSVLTNDILAGYFYQHPPSRPLVPFFYPIQHLKIETNLFFGYLFASVIMFLSSCINNCIPLSIYEYFG